MHRVYNTTSKFKILPDTNYNITGALVYFTMYVQNVKILNRQLHKRYISMKWSCVLVHHNRKEEKLHSVYNCIYKLTAMKVLC